MDLAGALAKIVDADIGGNARRLAEAVLLSNMRGERPTGRAIGLRFGWSKHTTSRAVRQLEQAGLVERDSQRSGLALELIGHEVAKIATSGAEQGHEVAKIATSGAEQGHEVAKIATSGAEQGHEVAKIATSEGSEGHEVAKIATSTTEVAKIATSCLERESSSNTDIDNLSLAHARVDGARCRKLLEGAGHTWHEIMRGSTGRMIAEWIEAGATEADVKNGIALARQTNRGKPDSPAYYRWAIREAIKQRKAPDGAGASGVGNGRPGEQAPTENIHGLDDKDYTRGATGPRGWLAQAATGTGLPGMDPADGSGESE